MKKTIAMMICVIFLFSGCASAINNAKNVLYENAATIVGAGGGAVVGKQVGGDTGAVVGFLIGGLLGKLIDKRRAELRKIAVQEKLEIEFEDIKEDDVRTETINSTNVASSPMAKEKKPSNAKIGDKVIISQENQFNINSTQLNESAKHSFARIANVYATNNQERKESAKILIIGHTDDSGSSEHNQKLSEGRAHTVGKIFVENGIDENDLYFLGAGEMQPIADNNSAEGASKNRRVEIVELTSEAQIAIYASNQKSNPQYFRQIIPSQQIIKTEPDKTKTPQIASSESKHPTPKMDMIVANNFTEHIKKVDNSTFIDFGGYEKKDSNFKLAEVYGSPIQEKSSFSFISKAFASNTPTVPMVECIFDKPRYSGEVKSMATQNSIQNSYRTSEYRPGMNQGTWVTSDLLNGNFIGLAPVGVLRNNATVTTNPSIYIYKNYVVGTNKKSDKQLHTKVNTYQGSDGLIYRIFIQDEKESLRCIDLAFDNENVNNARGTLYYANNKNMFQKEFQINQLGR
jgi:outer membrane protein OmpA-like peptidoglycan-associated protein